MTKKITIATVLPFKQKLENHPIYEAVETIEDLKYSNTVKPPLDHPSTLIHRAFHISPLRSTRCDPAQIRLSLTVVRSLAISLKDKLKASVI